MCQANCPVLWSESRVELARHSSWEAPNGRLTDGRGGVGLCGGSAGAEAGGVVPGAGPPRPTGPRGASPSCTVSSLCLTRAHSPAGRPPLPNFHCQIKHSL